MASIKGWVATGAAEEVEDDEVLPIERDRREELILLKIPRGLLG